MPFFSEKNFGVFVFHVGFDVVGKAKFPDLEGLVEEEAGVSFDGDGDSFAFGGDGKGFFVDAGEAAVEEGFEFVFGAGEAFDDGDVVFDGVACEEGVEVDGDAAAADVADGAGLVADGDAHAAGEFLVGFDAGPGDDADLLGITEAEGLLGF